MGIVKMRFVTLFLLALAAVGRTDAATYVVGDSLGWTIPNGGAADYTTWAAKHTYAPGDIMVFNFAAGIHDLATVNKTSFDSCSSTSPISLQTISPANITLTAAGPYYFICTFGQHCSLGQKLTVNVTSNSSTPAMPPTATTPTPATAPTPAAAVPTMPPATAAPTTPPSASPAPAPGATTASGGPTSTPSPATATPPGATASPPPTGETPSPPPPNSASRKAVAMLAIGLGFVAMGVIC